MLSTKDGLGELWRKITVGIVVAGAVVIPFLFTWVNEELFEFNKMLAVYAVATLALSAWFTRMIIEKRWIWKKTIFDYPLAAFILSQLLATVFSIHPYTSVFGYYTRWHGGMLSTLAYSAIFWTLSTNLVKKDHKWVLSAILGSALIASLYALPEHFGWSPSCTLISVSDQTPGMAFGVDCWIQDVKSRVFGTFGQPNWLAAYLILTIPLATALLVIKKTNLKLRIFSLISSTVMLAVLLFTQSRSGFLGLAVAGASLSISSLFWLLKNKKQAAISWIWLGGGLLAMLAIIGWFGTPFTPSIGNFIMSDPTKAAAQVAAPAPEQVVNRLDEGGSSSGEIRKIVWSGAIKVWQRYPFFGSGVETFAYSYYLDRPMAHNLVSEWDFLYNKAHNEFLNFLATTGVVGLVTYIIWQLTVIIYPIYLGAKLKNEESIILFSMSAGVLGLAVSNFFGFSTVAVTFLTYLFMAYTASLENQSTQNKVLAIDTKQWFLISLIWLVSIYNCFLIRTWWTADAAYKAATDYMKIGDINLAIPSFEKAIKQQPHEALFYDGLANSYAVLAYELANREQATAAAQVADISLLTSDKTLQLNPRHLNFYKSRVQIMGYLYALHPQALDEGLKTLAAAQELSPTDPKLVFSQGVFLVETGDTQAAINAFQKSISMKPNYEAARSHLGALYTKLDQPNLAIEQYQYILDNISPGKQEFIDKINELKKPKTKK